MKATDIFLRSALAFVFLYASVSQILNVNDWMGFVPQWVEIGTMTRELFLYANAFFEILLAAALLAGKWKRTVGWLVAFHFLLIAAVNGTTLLIITFRDIGLAGAALAYAYGADT